MEFLGVKRMVLIPLVVIQIQGLAGACHTTRWSTTLHPDIVKVIRNTAAEEKLTLSIVADEPLYAGLKALGRIDRIPRGGQTKSHPSIHRNPCSRSKCTPDPDTTTQ